MKFTFAHNNFNVTDLDKSLKFYEEALGLKEVRRKEAADGSFILARQEVLASSAAQMHRERLSVKRSVRRKH